MKKNSFPKVVTNPTSANRRMNANVYCQKKATPANCRMNANVKVSPRK